MRRSYVLVGVICLGLCLGAGWRAAGWREADHGATVRGVARALPSRAARGAQRAKEGIVLTVVYDNYKVDPELGTAWGFACVVQGLEKTILFDTGGEGKLLLGNMAKLGIAPGEIDVVVLSHIHHDHTGGLAAFLEKNPNVVVYALSSFPEKFKQSVKAAGGKVVEVSESVRICANALSTGELGTSIREQALVLETKDGCVVVTGCAHPGIVTMVRRAKELGCGKLDLALGGFHMSAAPESTIRNVIEQLQELGLRRAGPCHCSGDKTRELFAQAFGEGFVRVGVGAKIELVPADK